MWYRVTKLRQLLALLQQSENEEDDDIDVGGWRAGGPQGGVSVGYQNILATTHVVTDTYYCCISGKKLHVHSQTNYKGATGYIL